MRTLLLAPELFASEGGITRILRLYLKALCELAPSGDTVQFIALNDHLVDSGELRRYSDPHLTGWVACQRSKLRFCRAALRLGRSSDRIVCGHVAQLPIAWLAARLRPGAAVYLVAHGLEVWRPFTFLERLALRRATRILSVSEYTRGRILEFCPMPAERIVVLPNALDPYLEPGDPRAPPVEPPTILTVSRLTIADDYKGVGHLIEAMPEVLRAAPDAVLQIVGRGDGVPGLQARADRLGLRGHVVFTGYRSDADLAADFAACRLFALPSAKEGFGLVYLEAMAHGRPCLGARAGGVPEVITDATGILVEYADVPAIAAGIIAGLRRGWDSGAIAERAKQFSYLRFKERLGSLLAE